MKALSVVLFLSFSLSVMAESMPCWMDPNTIPETKQLAVLKTHLLPMNLETPENDLLARVSHEDFRFIAIGGLGIEYPGLNNKELLCIHGYRYITGTSDALESKEHGKLMQAFKHYAIEYNSKLESIINGK